jgi:hypothetical protein
MWPGKGTGRPSSRAARVAEWFSQVKVVATGGAVQGLGNGDQFGESTGGVIEQGDKLAADPSSQAREQQAVAVQYGGVVATGAQAPTLPAEDVQGRPAEVGVVEVAVRRGPGRCRGVDGRAEEVGHGAVEVLRADRDALARWVTAVSSSGGSEEGKCSLKTLNLLRCR